MYYAGIFCDDDKKECQAVVVEKVLRNARRQYSVMEIRKISFAGFAEDLKKLYEDPSLLRKKKVFSQDGRPSKNIFTPPVLIVSADKADSSFLLSARNNSVPVDGFILRDEQGWERVESCNLRYGSDFHVNRKELEKIYGVISSALMLWPEHSSSELIKLKEEAETLYPESDSSISAPMAALVSVVWHCETIRPVKRYGG